MQDNESNVSKIMEGPRSAALTYHEFGWEPLLLPTHMKKPKLPWKTPHSWTKDKIAQAFGAVNNIGIALGVRSRDLSDVDFDCPEAAALGSIVLADLPSFGRKSSLYSHRIAYCAMEKNLYKFNIPKSLLDRSGATRSVVLEIRGDGLQTMFPPSVHPSEEKVFWHDDPEDAPRLDPADLTKRGGVVAFASVLAMFYPGEPGERDEICMAIAGTLVPILSNDELIDDIIVCIATLAGDEEAEKRRGKAANARERIDANESVWGLPELCKRLGLEGGERDFRKWLGLSNKGAVASSVKRRNGNPTITIEPGNLPGEVDHLEQALIGSEINVYQRGEHLVRVGKLPKSVGEGGVIRPGGVSILIPVSPPWLREQLARILNWEKQTEGGTKVVSPPGEHATTYLARVGEWKVPVLNGLITTPTLRADGSILQSPGYDLEAGLLYDPGGTDFDLVPEHPSREQALQALHTFRQPFREFPFASDLDESVALSAALTSLIRRSLSTAPLFAIDAPTAGSGKTFISQVVGVIANGHMPTLISQGKTEEEDEKRIATVLMAGDAVIVVDNCERPITGDALCTVLTSEIWGARILGRSELARTPTNALFMATGNNLVVAGDMARRTIPCRLDPKSERPDQEPHSFDPREEALSDRPKLVVAGLTMLRAYIAAGRPMPTTPMGSFAEWNLVRDTMIWLGLPDPVTARERLMADDPRKSELATLLEIWFSAIGTEELTLAEIASRAESKPSPALKDLMNALGSMCRNGQFNTKSVGRHLLRHKDRIIAGRVLRAIPDSSGAQRYCVELIDPSPMMAEVGQDKIPF